jgi:hypothetical protein
MEVITECWKWGWTHIVGDSLGLEKLRDAVISRACYLRRVGGGGEGAGVSRTEGEREQRSGAGEWADGRDGVTEGKERDRGRNRERLLPPSVCGLQ